MKTLEVQDGAERLYSYHQVAALWSCSVRHLKNLVARGELRFVRVGRRVAIPASALSEFIDRNSKGGWAA